MGMAQDRITFKKINVGGVIMEQQKVTLEIEASSTQILALMQYAESIGIEIDIGEAPCPAT